MARAIRNSAKTSAMLAAVLQRFNDNKDGSQNKFAPNETVSDQKKDGYLQKSTENLPKNNASDNAPEGFANYPIFVKPEVASIKRQRVDYGKNEGHSAQEIAEAAAKINAFVFPASANALIRTGMNNFLMSLLNSGFDGVTEQLKRDPFSFVNRWVGRVPYGVLALQANQQVSLALNGGKKPFEMTNQEKMRSIFAGASAEFGVGIAMELYGLANQLRAEKSKQHFLANKGLLAQIPDNVFYEIIAKIKIEDVKNFIERNSDALKRIGINCDGLAAQEALELINKKENLAKMFENKIVIGLFSNQENQIFLEKLHPILKIAPKDFARAAASSSIPYIIRNCAFMAPYYYGYNNKEVDFVKLFAMSAGLGAATILPHNIGMSAMTNAVLGNSFFASLAKATRDNVENIKKDPRKILVAASCRAVANIIGAIIFHETTTNTIDNLTRKAVITMIEDEMIEACDGEKNILDEAQKKAVDENYANSPFAGLEDVVKNIEDAQKCRENFEEFSKLPAAKKFVANDVRGDDKMPSAVIAAIEDRIKCLEESGGKALKPLNSAQKEQYFGRNSTR